ncbi:MAG: glutaredoxin family protein [Candidatus Saccharimonadales bacterium]
MDTKIIVYGAEWCAFCHTAKEYFDKLGVKYEYRNVEEKPEWGKEAVDKSKQFGIPVLDMDGEIIIGFDKPKIDSALEKKGLKK